jgi:SAM-dependent methyltransferase
MESAEYERMHDLELHHWWFQGRRRILVDCLRQAVRAIRESRLILDYGCGTGGNTPAFAEFGTVIAIEPEAAAVRLAQGRGAAKCCRGSGTTLPFREGTFDVVVASDVLEHIETDERAVAEIARVLKPRGVAIVSVPAHPWLYSEHDKALQHFRRYRRPELRDLLQRNGLRIRRLSYWNLLLFPPICLRRLTRRIHGPVGARSDTRPAHPLLNNALTSLLRIEATVLRHASLPWGVSLLAIGQRL